MSVDYFNVLEIPSDADEREVKRAYHRLARELHPDKATSPEQAREFEEKFALVSAAYNKLKDPERRKESAAAKKDSPPAADAASASSRVMTRNRASDNQPAAAPSAAAAANRPAQGITPERVSIAQKAFARGMQFYKEENLQKAITFFEAAIQNNDQEAVYHARLAMALIRDKRSATRAIDAAQRSIELDPYNIEHKFNLGFIYETIGSKTNAIRIYEEILRWDADNERAKLTLKELNKKKSVFALAPAGADPGDSFIGRLLGRFKK